MQQVNPDSAISFIENNLSAANQKIDLKTNIELNKILALSYYQKSEIAKSMDLYQLILKKSSDINDSLSMAEAYKEIGRCYGDFWEFNQAIKHLNTSLNIYHNLNDLNGIASVYGIMAILYGQQKRFAESEKYYLDCLKLYQETNNAGKYASTCNNYALLLIELKQWKAAEHYLNIALNEKSKKDNHYYLAGLYTSFVKLYLSTEQSSKCDKYLDLLKQKGEYLNNKECIVLYYLYKSMNTKNPRIALTYLNTAEDRAKDIKISSIDLKILHQQKIRNAKIGNFERAYSYSEKIVQLKDSLFNNQRQVQISRMESLFENEKKAHEIKLLEKNNDLIRTRQNASIAVSVIFILFFISSIFYYRNHIKKKNLLIETERKLASIEIENSKIKTSELERDLEQKSKELTRFTLNLIEKNNQLEEIKQQLNKMMSKSEQVAPDLNKLQNLINFSIQSDASWTEFKILFENVNRDFFIRLKEKHPDLSQSEVKLCALTWLNLSIKDVASLLNIGPDSVKTARHRLRKKLNLQTEENLYNYIQNV